MNNSRAAMKPAMPQAARPNVAPVAPVRSVVPTTVAHGQCPPGNRWRGKT